MLLDVHCQGTERSIAQCRHKGWNRLVCNHYEDASVRCNTPQIQGHKVLPLFRPDITSHVYSSLSWLKIRLLLYQIDRYISASLRTTETRLTMSSSRHLLVLFLINSTTTIVLHRLQGFSPKAYRYLRMFRIYFCIRLRKSRPSNSGRPGCWLDNATNALKGTIISICGRRSSSGCSLRGNRDERVD